MVVKETDYDDSDLGKLRYAFPGLNIYFLALVWDFAEYLLKLQASLEEYEKAKGN